MLRESLDYIRRNYISETVIKHHDRAEATRVENFPYPAIEEAVVNAIYHRGYDVREPVEVRIIATSWSCSATPALTVRSASATPRRQGHLTPLSEPPHRRFSRNWNSPKAVPPASPRSCVQ